MDSVEVYFNLFSMGVLLRMCLYNFPLYSVSNKTLIKSFLKNNIAFFKWKALQLWV